MQTYTQKSLLTSAILGVSGLALLLVSRPLALAAHNAPEASHGHGPGILEVVSGVPSITFTIAGTIAIVLAIGFVAQIPFNAMRNY